MEQPSRDAVLVIPVKPLASAKSRLRSEIGTAARSLVVAMLLDVVAAALDAARVAEVVVMTSDPVLAGHVRIAGARVLHDRVGGEGLNGALRMADLALRPPGVQRALIAQPADCPCATGTDFDAVLRRVAELGRCYVGDADGTGTTTLAAPAGAALNPQYGPGSANRHRQSGAVPVAGQEWLRLRRDVDTRADLDAALRIGVGAHTRSWHRAWPTAAD